MRIESIASRVGSKRVSNQDIVDMVKRESCGIHKGELHKTLEQIEFYLEHSGAKERRWCDAGETPIGMLQQAATQALAEAGMQASDVELLIHVGLGRGFMEAGQSYFVAQALNMESVHCFDIMDACNSWVRGMFLAFNLLKNGTYQRIMLVNTECNMLPGGIINPSCFRMRSFDALHHSFAGLTLADGVTATVVTSATHGPWEFKFESQPMFADICAVPADNFTAFSLPSDYLGLNGVHRFTSFAKRMQEVGYGDGAQAFADSYAFGGGAVDWIFPHGHSTQAWEGLAIKMGIDSSLLRLFKWNTYERVGNLASASVPTAIRMGMDAGEVRRGQTLETWMGSGGMSFSLMRFVL